MSLNYSSSWDLCTQYQHRQLRRAWQMSRHVIIHDLEDVLIVQQQHDRAYLAESLVLGWVVTCTVPPLARKSIMLMVAVWALLLWGHSEGSIQHTEHASAQQPLSA